MHEGLKVIFVSLYEQKYRTTTGRTTFKLRRTPHANGFIDRFLARLTTKYGSLSPVGPEYFRTYLDHAFGKNAGRSFHGNQNVIPINFILSQSTIDDFLTSNRGRKWGMRTRLKRVALAPGLIAHEVQNSYAQQVKQAQEKSTYSALPREEERERLRFHNSLKGYMWCGQETTMNHPASPACAECKRAADCCRRQADNYPSIYQLRKSLPR